MIRFYLGLAGLGMSLMVQAAVVPLDFSNGWQVNNDVGAGRTINLIDGKSGSLVTTLSAPPKVLMPSMNIDVPTSQGLKSLALKDIAQKVASSRIASSAGKILKTLPYVGTAIAVADLFCDVTSVCHNTAGTGYDKVNTPPAQSQQLYYYTSQADNPAVNYTTLTFAEQHTCAVFGGAYGGDQQVSTTAWTVYCGIYGYRVNRVTACPTNYHIDGAQCTLNAGQTATRTPATDADWESAYAYYDSQAKSLAAMNTMAHFVVDNNAPLPVDEPEFDPQFFVIPNLDRIDRGSDGTVTGTTHVDDTIQVIRGTDPYTAATTETVTTTTKNPSGVVTGTQTTTTSNPVGTPVQEPKPQPPTIDIDNVPDVTLPTYSNPATLSTTSWGGGTCPANPSINLLGHNFQISISTLCSSIALLRPFIILLAFLMAAFIVSGVKYD